MLKLERRALIGFALLAASCASSDDSSPGGGDTTCNACAPGDATAEGSANIDASASGADARGASLDATTTDTDTEPVPDGALSDAPIDSATSDVTLGDALAPPDAGATPFDAATRDAASFDASGAIPDGATTDGASAAALCTASSCASNETLCLGICASNADPAYGCGASSCQPCTLANARATCSTGACAIAQCAPGWADCNNDPSDGCEADLSSPTSCGTCGVQCTAPSGLCASTGCVASCTPPATSCNDDAGPSSGRCVDLSTSPQNCGSCGTSCTQNSSVGGFGTCSAGQCGLTCYSPYTICGAACVDTTRTDDQCGSCTNSCPSVNDAVHLCTGSTCGAVCQPGWTVCGSACVTTQTDRANCGGCGHACASGDICAAGACVPLASVSLATGVTVLTMAVDSSGVYWTDGTANVQSTGLTGGPVVSLAESQAQPTGIALDDVYVYWSDTVGGAIFRTAKDGSGSPSVVTSATSPGAIGLFGDDVYWIDQSANVWKNSKADGGAPAIAISPGAGNASLIANAHGVFVENRSFPFEGVYSVLAGWHAGALNPYAPLVDDGQQLFLEVPNGVSSNEIESVSESDGGTGAYYVPRTNGSPLPVAANACGVFLQDGTLVQPRSAFAAQVVTSVPIQAGAIFGGYFYFYANQSIGRLPLP